jgi:mono/diheme cytochrome c family protein
MRLKRSLIATFIILALLAAAGIAYRTFVPGLSSARSEPPELEVAIATWLLHQSVPETEAARTNPLGSDPAEVAAGSDLFKQKCEICHAYDGSGQTEIGSGEYPRPPALRAINVAALSDGEIFYHIRNGIRNTGMPAWQMPDRNIWQLVAFIRKLPQVALPSQEPWPHSPAASTARHVGSAACKNCHTEMYGRWAKSRMSNVVRDPCEHRVAARTLAGASGAVRGSSSGRMGGYCRTINVPWPLQ